MPRNVNPIPLNLTVYGKQLCGLHCNRTEMSILRWNSDSEWNGTNKARTIPEQDKKIVYSVPQKWLERTRHERYCNERVKTVILDGMDQTRTEQYRNRTKLVCSILSKVIWKSD